MACHIKENISYLRRTDLDWMSQDWTDVFRSKKAPKQSYFVDIDPSSDATLQFSLIYYNKILMMYFLSQILSLLFLVTLIVIWWPLSVMRPIVYNARHIYHAPKTFDKYHFLKQNTKKWSFLFTGNCHCPSRIASHNFKKQCKHFSNML